MSVLVIGKGSIEEKIKRETRFRAQERRKDDEVKGLTLSKGPKRGDFKQCQELDKVLSDYRRFTSPKDREKITREYEGRQREMRRI